MKMRSSSRLLAVALVAIALASCGNSGDAADGQEAEVSAAGDGSTDLSLDASTAEAMSIDVAAGGVDPAVDPANVDAGERIVELDEEADAAQSDDPLSDPTQ